MKYPKLTNRVNEPVNPYQSPQSTENNIDTRPFSERHPNLYSACFLAEILSTGALILGAKIIHDYYFRN